MTLTNQSTLDINSPLVISYDSSFGRLQLAPRVNLTDTTPEDVYVTVNNVFENPLNIDVIVNPTYPNIANLINPVIYVNSKDFVPGTDYGNELASKLIPRGDFSTITYSLGPGGLQATITEPVPFCVHPDTKVLTTNGLMKISDIKSDSGVKVIDPKGTEIDVIYNIKNPLTKDYIKISAGSLGENVPSEDLYIRDGHPILLDNKEVMPETLVNDDSIKRVKMDKADYCYSLCTKGRLFVMMNGIPVCTWDEAEWQETSNKNEACWSKN